MLSTTLPNGLRVLVQENHSSKVAAIQVWVRVGSADELPHEAGLAHVHEHMLFKGTERRGVGEIAAEIEAAGGDINAWTSYDQTVYHVTMASRDFPVGLDILADAVQHSSFDPGELSRELEVVLEEIRRGKDMPSRVASENLFKTAYVQHPYCRPVIGYVESVKSFTRDGILEFYKKWYRPRNMCLVVVGDVDAKDVLARAEKLFRKDSSTDLLPQRPRTPEPAQASLRTIVEHEDIQETHLGVAWQGVELRHEDTPALDVLAVLLGNGDSSRLFRRVKRDQELVNDCYAYAYTPQDPGLVLVGATIHGSRTADAYRALLREAYALRDEPPLESEVQKAKTILLADAVYQKETVQGIARKIGFFELVAGSPDYEDTYYEGVRRVTPEAVRAAADRYLRTERMTVSVLAPKAQEGALDHGKIQAIAAEVEAERESAKKQKAPVISPAPDGVAKLRLSNGATLVIKEDHAVPLVSIRAVAWGGLLAEQPKVNGISHLVSELVVRGTESFTAEQLAEEIDSTASNIGGMSGRNSLGLRGDFLKEHWPRGFELFSSCLLESIFDAKEIEKERKTQLEDIAARQDNLSSLVFENLAASMWNEHPYRMPLMGTKESVEAITRDDILTSYRAQLRPDRLTIAVVGAVNIPETVQLIEKRIGRARPHPEAPVLRRPAVEPTFAEPRSSRLEKKKEQAHLVLGFPGVSLADERRWSLEVLASILAGQGGRLFLELRDKQSLAYSVTAFSMEGLDPGYFAVYIGTANEKLEKAESGMRAELAKILEADADPAELERAQRYLIGSHEVALQRASARAGTMAFNEAYGLGYEEYARYADRIMAVTARRVRDAAREIIRFDRVVRALVAAPDGEAK